VSGRKRYERAITSLAERKESKSLILSGILGVTTGGENAVEVEGRPGFVWVRLRNQLNELIQAFNESVSPVFDLPVLVEYDKASPTRYKVMGRDVGRYTVWGAGTSDTSSYLPRHASQHQFDTLTGIGGGDVAWIYSQQFMPWLVTPSGSSGALSVSVQPMAYYYDDQFRWAGGTGVAGFDNLRPTGSSNARMLLVYLDPDSGNPYLATGTLTEFANTITGTAQILPYMPSLIEATDVPLAGIRLITGTSVLLWPNVYDLRDYFVHSSVSGTSGDGGAPTDAEYVVMSLNGTLTDERVLTAGSDITLADGGAGGNATVGVATGTFSRAGHGHLYPYSVAIYDDHVFQATGTILDFTGNINVAVTGTSVFISSTAAGGGGATLLIYDDGVFKVTGTALDFEDDLKIDVTGSVAYVNIPTGTFSRPGHVHTNELPIFDSSVFKSTGTLISFDDNLTVHVTGTTVFIEGQAGASGDNTILIYDGSAFKVTGSAISFDDNLTVHITGSTAYVVGQAGGAGGFPIIYDDSVFKNTGVAISFDEDIEAVATGTTSYVGIPTGTFSRPGHTHTETNTLLFYEDDVFVATGTAIDFGENVNVAVTGSVLYVSTVDTQGGGGGDLLIYDDSAFKVTGTALDFGDNISVVVTGSTAYINSALTEAALDIGARVYNNAAITISTSSSTELTFNSEHYDTDSIHSTVSNTGRLTCQTAGKYLIGFSGAFDANATGYRSFRILLNGSTRISEVTFPSNSAATDSRVSLCCPWDCNVGDYFTVEVYQTSGGDLNIDYNGTIHYISPEFWMQKIDGLSANRIPIYDDSVIQTTGTSISFDENLDVSVTGTIAYIDAKHPTGTAGYVPQFVSAGDSVEDSIIFGTSTGISIGVPKILMDMRYSSPTWNLIKVGHDINNTEFIIDGGESNHRYLGFQTSGSFRWIIDANSDPETGGNTGTNFKIYSYTDAGATLNNPITIHRTTGDVVIQKDIYTSPWQDYSDDSSITGWLSYTTKKILYKQVGNLIFVNYHLNGIATGTSASFTLPGNNNGGVNTLNLFRCFDGGIWKGGHAVIVNGTNAVLLYSNIAGGSWSSSSGTRSVQGEIFYEAA
jgi:hypothetical protein